MTTKRTKSDLVDEINAINEEMTKLALVNRKLRSEVKLITQQSDHWSSEAERLSKRCKSLSESFDKEREKHGDFVVTAQSTLINAVEIMRTTRPRLERRDNSAAYSALFPSSFNAPSDDDVRSFDDRPF